MSKGTILLVAIRWPGVTTGLLVSMVVRSGLPTGGLPRCREVGSIQHVIYCFHGREVGFTDMWLATMS